MTAENSPDLPLPREYVPREMRGWAVGLFLASCVFAILVALAPSSGGWRFVAVAFVPLATAILAWMIGFRPRLIVSDEGLIVRNATRTYRIPWNRIVRAVVYRSYLRIVTVDGSAVLVRAVRAPSFAIRREGWRADEIAQVIQDDANQRRGQAVAPSLPIQPNARLKRQLISAAALVIVTGGMIYVVIRYP